MLELGRILNAAGPVTAATGLVIFAMGAAYHDPASFEMNLGIILMVVGIIAFIIGAVVYRQASPE
ncbi:MAG TPA: hypothetical protein VNZ55_10695 [Thermomicrobiales bacterium]|nr:hypothetical protein [Thermomicrobiales bacterium]